MQICFFLSVYHCNILLRFITIVCHWKNLARFCLIFMEYWHFNYILVRADHQLRVMLLIHLFSFVTTTAEVVTITAVWIIQFFMSILYLRFLRLFTEFQLLLIIINSFFKWPFIFIFQNYGGTDLIYFFLTIYFLIIGFLFNIFLFAINLFCLILEWFGMKTLIFRIIILSIHKAPTE